MAKITALVSAALLALVVTTSGAASSKTIKLKDDTISPKSLTVKKGSKATVKWVGKHPHNLVGGGVKTATKTSGSTVVKFKKKGSFTLVCQIHSGMKIKVKVK